MNAYELADDAKNISNTIEALEYVQKAVPMLRQQADRIAELEKQYDAMVMSFEARLATRGYEIQIKDQQDRIAELEKQLDMRTKELIGASLYEHDYKTLMANSEPVAWMLVDEINGDYMLERHPSGDYDWTPLYTTPQTKPLSDEEIFEIADIFPFIENGVERCAFARAIEAKVRGQ